MKTSTKNDLEDLTLVLEHLVKQLPDLKRSERIDVAARIRAAGKHIKTIEEAVKDEVKKARDGVEGYVNGETWRAKLSLVPVKRLDQKAFKGAEPDLYEQYSKDNEDQRVTYEPR